MTALDVIFKPELLERIREDFKLKLQEEEFLNRVEWKEDCGAAYESLRRSDDFFSLTFFGEGGGHVCFSIKRSHFSCLKDMSWGHDVEKTH